MRQITIDSVNAFYNNKPFKRNNTQVEVTTNQVIFKLHNNVIAKKSISTSKIEITTASWNTRTTRERLNGFENVVVRKIKGKLYLNGNLWDGNLIKID